MLLSRSSAPRMSLLQLKFCTSCIRTRLWVVGRKGRWVRWRAPPCATFSRVNRNMKTFYGCCCCCCCSRSSSATHIVYILYIVFFSLPPHAAPPLYFASVTGHSPTHTHTRVCPSGVHCISMLLAWKLLYKMLPSYESWVRFLWAWSVQTWLISC